MDRDISKNPEQNKANFFKKKTTGELERELPLYQGLLHSDRAEEIQKRKPIIDTVENFYNNLRKYQNHRFMSWEHCFNAFQSTTHYNDLDYLSLQLAFYLASWGMYRGSSGLLWKDYKIHIDTVKIIQKYKRIHCSADNEIDESQIDLILQAKEDIKKNYEKIEYFRPTKGGDKKYKVSATDTLVTKILLGTLGCVPAYDRLLRIGFDEITDTKIGKSFNEKSLRSLFVFIDNNRPAFEEVKAKINKDGIHYPLMKIVDMYFWELGFQKNPELVEKE